MIIKSISVLFLLCSLVSKAEEKASTEIDFEGGQITGKRRTPLQSIIQSNKHRVKHSFLQIRKNWHDKMIASTLSLDYAKGTMRKKRKRKKK
jgi:hypothetical protein